MARKLLNDHRLIDDLEHYLDIAIPLGGQNFNGIIALNRLLTSYDPHIIDTTETITPSDSPLTGAGAEVNLIADGSHTPVFSGMTKSVASSDWDTTLGRVHKTIFYYDGTIVYYSHTYLD